MNRTENQVSSALKPKEGNGGKPGARTKTNKAQDTADSTSEATDKVTTQLGAADSTQKKGGGSSGGGAKSRKGSRKL